jgi:hypothetical protein
VQCCVCCGALKYHSTGSLKLPCTLRLLQGQAALPAAELFRRHPQLHAFLGAQLAEAVAGLSGSGITDAGDAGSGAGNASGGGGGTHPSLLPVLTLLSRLGWVSEAVHDKSESIAWLCGFICILLMRRPPLEHACMAAFKSSQMHPENCNPCT